MRKGLEYVGQSAMYSVGLVADFIGLDCAPQPRPTFEAAHSLEELDMAIASIAAAKRSR